MILITGHEGFVGGHLHRRYPSAICLEKTEAFHDWHAQLSFLATEHKLTTVVHAGAISANQYKDLDIFDWNTYATKAIANLCQDQGLHLIYFSSITAEYPKTLYGHSKKIAEWLIKDTAELDACILRPFNIYGEGEDVRGVENRSLPYRLADRELKVLWDTERDYIHVLDVVAAVQHALENRIIGTYHLGTGEVTPSAVLANLVRYNGYTCEDRPPHIEFGAAADPEKFLPGWQPTVDVRDEIKVLEAKLNDPFDAVEISTKRAAKHKERRFLTDAEMVELDCSAQAREI